MPGLTGHLMYVARHCTVDVKESLIIFTSPDNISHET